MSNNILAARIKARNRVNQLANELQEKLIKDFTPLIGKKVVNADNYLSEKFKKLKPYVAVQEAQFYQQASEYSLGFIVKVSEQISGNDCGCVYEEAHFYVGNLSNCVLTKVYNGASDRRTNYTVEEIIKVREFAEQKREEARQAENALCGFGTYDR
jgi:hypothetical protein